MLKKYLERVICEEDHANGEKYGMKSDMCLVY